MKNFWLNKNNNKKLVVFFSGWGMDEKSVQHIICDDFDVLSFFDYRNLKIDEKIFDQINSYPEVYISAWSMGVMVSAIFEARICNVASKIAIAGTLFPIDDKYGIPNKIYDLTLNNFNDLSKRKFLRKMFAVDETKFINRNTCELKDELVALKNMKISSDIFFDKAFVPLQDKIIPVQNQFAFWHTRPQTKIIEINCGHYPFFKLKSWMDILK